MRLPPSHPQAGMFEAHISALCQGSTSSSPAWVLGARCWSRAIGVVLSPPSSMGSGTPAQPRVPADMCPPEPSISPTAGPPALASSHPVTMLPSSPERVFGFVPVVVCVTSPACLIHGAGGRLAAGAPLAAPPAPCRPISQCSKVGATWDPLLLPAFPSQPRLSSGAGAEHRGPTPLRDIPAGLQPGAPGVVCRVRASEQLF